MASASSTRAGTPGQVSRAAVSPKPRWSGAIDSHPGCGEHRAGEGPLIAAIVEAMQSKNDGADGAAPVGGNHTRAGKRVPSGSGEGHHRVPDASPVARSGVP